MKKFMHTQFSKVQMNLCDMRGEDIHGFIDKFETIAGWIPHLKEETNTKLFITGLSNDFYRVLLGFKGTYFDYQEFTIKVQSRLDSRSQIPAFAVRKASQQRPDEQQRRYSSSEVFDAGRQVIGKWNVQNDRTALWGSTWSETQKIPN
jgi:hypothetical protein